jgi:Translation initiation factor 1A / IF-1
MSAQPGSSCEMTDHPLGSAANFVSGCFFSNDRTRTADDEERTAGISSYRIRVLADDKVLVEMTPYDLTKGRITYRFK